MNFILRRVDAKIFASSFQHPAKNLHASEQSSKAFIFKILRIFFTLLAF